MKALVLGGGNRVWHEADAALSFGPFDMVLAVNDIGVRWRGQLDYWCTLHPDKLSNWMTERRMHGIDTLPKIVSYSTHIVRDGTYVPLDLTVDYRWNVGGGSGSSGLYAVKVALHLGATKIVLAGVPLDPSHAHFFSPKRWEAAGSFQQVWIEVLPKIKPFVRSMSGWTADLLGRPSPDWFADASR